jgi:SAM-dependent methyltransferase
LKFSKIIQTTTREEEYTRLLVAKQKVWWKRFCDVQIPYRWNLQRLNPGLTLDIGCGIGRNLVNLRGFGVGLDHNVHSIRVAKDLGLPAFTPFEFLKCEYNNPETFDSILLSHVAEHMTRSEVVEILRKYLPLLKQNGQIIIHTPQEMGYRSDPTHVEFMDWKALEHIVKQIGFRCSKTYSFPFPRIFGHLFKYNEFVFVGRRV